MISPKPESDASDVTGPRREGSNRHWILLLVFAILILFERWHTFSEPLERDAAGYAVIGHEMLRGRELYSDLWERKPPLLYAMFSLAEKLVGYGPREIYLLTVSTAIVTLVGLFFAARNMSPNHFPNRAGLLAAGLWAIIGGDLYVQSNQPNTEVFINSVMIWALVILFRMAATELPPNESTRPRYGWSLLLGGLFATATLYKHNVVFMVGILCLGYLIMPGVKRLYLKRAAEMGITLLVIAIVWSSFVIYFANTERLEAFIDVLFRQNLDYAGSIRWNLSRLAQPFVLKAIFVRWGIAPATLIVVWMVIEIWRNKGVRFSKIWILTFAGAVGAWLTIASPGRFFPHYYQLAMPVLCLATAGAASGLLDPQLMPSRLLAIAMIGVVFGVSIVREGSYYLLRPDDWTTRKNVGAFVQQYVMADRLKGMLQTDERFWNFGSDTTLYYGTRQSPICGLIYLDPLQSGSGAEKYWVREMQALRATPPDLIVISRDSYYTVGLDAPVFPWIHENYSVLGVDPLATRYMLMVRKTSPLERRVHSDANYTR